MSAHKNNGPGWQVRFFTIWTGQIAVTRVLAFTTVGRSRQSRAPLSRGLLPWQGPLC